MEAEAPQPDRPLTDGSYQPGSTMLGIGLAVMVAFLFCGAFAAIFFLAALFLPGRALGTAALLSLSAAMVSKAAIEVWRAWLLYRLGVWTDLDRQRRTRPEQPIKFWVWVSTHLLAAGICVSGAVFLAAVTAPELR
jgi:hypothetical protein